MNKKNVYYPLFQTFMVGQLSCEIQALRSLFPSAYYNIHLITYPLSMFEGINIDLFHNLTKGIEVVFSRNRAIVEANQDIRSTPDKIGIHQTNDGLYVAMPPEKLVELSITQFGRVGLPWQSILSPDEMTKATEIRSHLGIPVGAKIVTIHVRDEYNLDSLHFYKYRNADINNYIPAINYLIEQGYYVIRLGDSRMRKINFSSRFLVDGPFCKKYSNCFDMFMIAQSSFYIGMQSGPLTVAHVFGVPVLLANAYYCYGMAGYSKSLMIPKKYFSRQLNRTLSLSEILYSPLLNYNHSDMFTMADVELKENCPSEILLSLKELEGRMLNNYNIISSYEESLEPIWSDFKEHIKQKPPVGGYMINTTEYIQLSHEFIKLNQSYLGHRWPNIASDACHRILTIK